MLTTKQAETLTQEGSMISLSDKGGIQLEDTLCNIRKQREQKLWSETREARSEINGKNQSELVLQKRIYTAINQQLTGRLWTKIDQGNSNPIQLNSETLPHERKTLGFPWLTVDACINSVNARRVGVPKMHEKSLRDI